MPWWTLSNLRTILTTETDADGGVTEESYSQIRENLECLIMSLLDTGDSGSATENPPNDSTGVLTDSGAAYDVDEHNGRTLLITSGLAIGNLYTIDDGTATTIICTGDNLYSDGVRSGDTYKILYDLKTNADGHDHDGINSKSIGLEDGQVTEAKIANLAVTEGKIGNSAVAQAKLKTSTGSVNQTGTQANLTLPGGEYGFYPQTKASPSDSVNYEVLASMGGNDGTVPSGTYITNIFLGAETTATGYAQQRYITSSGEVFWLYILIGKSTGSIISMWQAPDHPCMGNGGKPALVPHPFRYNPVLHDLFVINPSKDEVLSLRERAITDDVVVDLDGLKGFTEADTLEFEDAAGLQVATVGEILALKKDVHPDVRFTVVRPDRDILEVIRDEHIFTDHNVWPEKEVTVGLPKRVPVRTGRKLIEIPLSEVPLGTKITPHKRRIPYMQGMKIKKLEKKQ